MVQTGSDEGNEVRKSNNYEPPRRAEILCADDIQLRRLDILVRDILIRGKVTELAGPPGTGKGAIETALAARVTRGACHPSWPDNEPTTRGKVLFLTGREDNPADTLIPRLMAHGADLRRVFCLKCFWQQGEPVETNLGTRDIAAIENFMRQYGGGFSLLVIDPLSQAIDGDSTSQAKVIRSMDNLAMAAERLDVAILGGHHVVKAARGRDPLGRVAGPLAYGGKPRCVWVTTPCADGNTYGLVNVKTSLTAPAGGWGYRIESAQVADEYGLYETSVVRWLERYEGRPGDILERIEQKPSRKQSALQLAEVFLLETLRGGPVPYPEVCRRAQDAGISNGTLMRAKHYLQVSHQKQSGVRHGQSLWFLQDSEPTA